MAALTLHARVQLIDDGFAVHWRLEGHPPRYHERRWSDIEAWGVGRASPAHPEGIYLLLREPPHSDFLWIKAEGVLEAIDALRARLPEWSAADVQAEIDKRELADIEVEARTLFPPERWNEVRALLEGEERLRSPNVRRAVVKLSRGDVARLQEMIAAARLDPRDVLMWAQMESAKS